MDRRQPCEAKSCDNLVTCGSYGGLFRAPISRVGNDNDRGCRQWSYEVKLDGFRLEAVKTAGVRALYSRRGNMLNDKFPYIAGALKKLPDATILDGEVVALDSDGRSNFSLLQNFRSAETHILFYAFDLLVLKGKSIGHLRLDERRHLLEKTLPLNEHVSLSVVDHRSLSNIMTFVRNASLEGVVAKRNDSPYEPGRSGRWSKHRLNQGQEFVIGGYTPGSNGFDALIVGLYRGNDLLSRRGSVKGSSPRRVDRCSRKSNRCAPHIARSVIFPIRRQADGARVLLLKK